MMDDLIRQSYPVIWLLMGLQWYFIVVLIVKHNKLVDALLKKGKNGE